MRRTRRQRPVWVGIVVVAVFFAGVTLAFAWLGGGPDIPHAAADGRAACTTCHPADGLPDGHEGGGDDRCRSCHSQGPAEVDVPAGGRTTSGSISPAT